VLNGRDGGHGSLLKSAVSELGNLSTQGLDRRASDWRSPERQVAAWLCERNPNNIKADWRFTAADVRKLKLRPGTLVA